MFTGSIDLNRAQQILSETVLPKIGEGITLTKDYILDIGQRYIMFNIIMLSLVVVAWVALFVFGIYLIVRSNKKFVLRKKREEYKQERAKTGREDRIWIAGDTLSFLTLLVGIAILIPVFYVIWDTIELLKWIVIPEVPLFQDLMKLKELF